MSNVEFLETAPKFRKRETSSSCVYVLHKTCHQEISRPSRAVMAKKCTKKCKCTCRVVVLVIKPIAFLTLLLPSLLLKLPKNSNCGLFVVLLIS